MALRILVSVWLLILSVLDVRYRRLPHLLTTVPLVVLGVAAAIRSVSAWLVGGNNVANPLALALAFVAILASDTWAALSPAVGALWLAFWWGTPSGQIAVVGWLTALALAKAGIVGAGDSKVAMVLLALFPDLRLAVCLVVVIVLVSGFLLIRRMGPATPLLVWSVVRDGLAGHLPARTGEKGVVQIPLVPVMTLGTLFYLWVMPGW